MNRVIIAIIKGYQILLSPIFPPSCRFTPTCSNYTIEAVKRYGVFKGLGMGLWRVLRCNPFSKGGYDPVR